MDRTEQTREWMSALVDGQLRDVEFSQAMQRVADDAEALRAWRDYQAIGDALRSGDRACGGASSEFLQKLQAQLAAQPLPQREAPLTSFEAVNAAPPAANDGRWKIAAGFASVAALAALTWNVVAPTATSTAPQMAATPATVIPVAVTEPPRGNMVRDPSLDKLLAAHRQLGSATVLQQPAGFLRNATFEGAGR